MNDGLFNNIDIENAFLCQITYELCKNNNGNLTKNLFGFSVIPTLVFSVQI
jgi:hypothetical protein